MIPKNAYKKSHYCSLSGNVPAICKIIRKQKYDLLCINDGENDDEIDFKNVQSQLIQAFDSILPEKCRFEK